MNPAQLLEHFDRISEAPDAVARLRRFILDLAVRGKLVEQDPNDEPAAELLKRIQVEKARLVKEEKIRKQKPLRQIGTDEVPCSSPLSWKWDRLGNLSNMITKGSTPTSYGHAFTRTGVNFIKIESIKKGHLLPENVTSFISEETHNFLARSQLEVGDILFSIAGSIGTCSVVTVDVLPANTNQALAIIRGTQLAYNPAFLLSCIQSSVAQVVLGKARGGAMNNVSLEDIQNFVIPLPPLAEQHRIVAKVDELMALCDQLEAVQSKRETRRDRLVAASLHRIGTALPESLPVAARFHLDNLPRLTTRLEHIKQLRQTILNLAVRGRLVPQDPNDEPAVTLLKRLGVQIVKSQADANRQPIPAIWEWVTIDQIATVGSGTTPSRDVSEYYSPTGTPWVTSGETNNAFIAQTAQHVSERALKETSLKLYPPGTLIVAMYGQGKTRGQIAELSIAATTNQACASIVLKLEDVAHRNYVKLYFQKIYEEIRELAAGGSQPNLNGGKIKSTLIPFPPLAEQYRIVAKVDELMALCDQLEAQLATTKIDSRRLLEAVLRDAIDSSVVAVG